jgi:hypothetical protein
MRRGQRLALLGFACREGSQPGTSLQFYGTEVACRKYLPFSSDSPVKSCQLTRRTSMRKLRTGL